MSDTRLLEAAKKRLAAHDKAVDDVSRLEEVLIEAFKEIRGLQSRIEILEKTNHDEVRLVK